ncbi:MAG: ABC transporter permease [Actinomadura sp.]
MARYLLRRLGQALLVVAGVVVITFVVMRVVPGDPAVAYAGPRASRAELAEVRARLGLDRPLPLQLGGYVSDLLRGDWGTSLHTRRPVLRDLARAFPASLELVGAALLLAVALGLPLGVAAARFQRRPADLGIRLSSMLAASVPVFWLALVLQNVFATGLGWFPVAGEYDSALDYTSPLRVHTGITVVDAALTGNGPVLVSALWHLVLPAAVVAAYPVAVVTQLTRAGLIEEAAQDHARLERALGFSERAVLTRFALRPVLAPVLSLLALVFAFSLVNTFLVEAVFNWPGLGRYAADAIHSLDTPAIAGVTILVAVGYVLANLVVDLLQTVIDPRVSPR